MDSSTMSMLSARMSALAKLTETGSKESPHIPPFDLNKNASKSWHSLLPSQDPMHAAEPSHTIQQEESWKSLINVHSSYGVNDSREIFLGPVTLASPAGSRDMDDLIPTFGRRADLFVRRSSMVSHGSLQMHRTYSSQPSTDSEMCASPPAQHDLRRSSPASELRPHSLSNSRVHSYDFDYMQEQRSSSSSFVMDNERANWPTSTRHQAWHELPTSKIQTMSTQSKSRSESELAPTAFGTTPLMQKSNSMPKSTSMNSSTDPSMTDILPNKEASTSDMSLYSVEINDHDVIMSPEDRRVAISTTPDVYSVTIHIPGVSIDGLTLAMKGPHRRTLHVMANRWDSDEHFERRITFAPDADMASIRARFEDGHLYVDVYRKGGTLSENQYSDQASALSRVGIQNRSTVRSALF